MSRPSNIKIQKTGAEEIGNPEVCSPASDLERWPNTRDGFDLSSGANANALDWRYGGNSSA